MRLSSRVVERRADPAASPVCGNQVASDVQGGLVAQRAEETVGLGVGRRREVEGSGVAEGVAVAEGHAPDAGAQQRTAIGLAGDVDGATRRGVEGRDGAFLAAVVVPYRNQLAVEIELGQPARAWRVHLVDRPRRAGRHPGILLHLGIHHEQARADKLHVPGHAVARQDVGGGCRERIREGLAAVERIRDLHQLAVAAEGLVPPAHAEALRHGGDGCRVVAADAGVTAGVGRVQAVGRRADRQPVELAAIGRVVAGVGSAHSAPAVVQGATVLPPTSPTYS
jgi:hypothetical protein